MDYSTRRFVVCLSVCHFVLVFFSPFTIAISRLGKRGLILVLFVRLFGLCLFRFVGFLFLLGSGKAAVCDCGTPWTFILPFLRQRSQLKRLKEQGKTGYFHKGKLKLRPERPSLANSKRHQGEPHTKRIRTCRRFRH